MTKHLITILILTATLFPSTSFAFDQRCFTKEQCLKVRSEFNLSSQEAAEGFIEKPKECGTVQIDEEQQIMGFCLPSDRSITQISFGGKKEFLNLGDYIQTIYRFAIMAAAILAIIMIIVAGLQWITSGGNAQRIGSAKKRIGGAIVGLLLAVGSYTLLANINPALVELRLPQVWLINPINIIPERCDQLDTKVAAALTKEELGKMNPSQLSQQKEERLKKAKYLIPPEDTLCGYEYFVLNGGNQTCKGTKCSDNKLCFPINTKTLKYEPTCETSQLAIYFKMTSLKENVRSAFTLDIGTVLNFDWLDDEADWNDSGIMPVCSKNDDLLCIGGDEGEGRGLEDEAGHIPKVKFIPTKTEGYYEYITKYEKITDVRDEDWGCPDNKEPKGFIIKHELDDNDAEDMPIFIGMAPSTNQAIVDIAIDIDYKKYYIPYEQLKTGLFLYLEINDSILAKLDKAEDDGREKMKMPESTWCSYSGAAFHGDGFTSEW